VRNWRCLSVWVGGKDWAWFEICTLVAADMSNRDISHMYVCIYTCLHLKTGKWEEPGTRRPSFLERRLGDKKMGSLLRGTRDDAPYLIPHSMNDVSANEVPTPAHNHIHNIHIANVKIPPPPSYCCLSVCLSVLLICTVSPCPAGLREYRSSILSAPSSIGLPVSEVAISLLGSHRAPCILHPPNS